MGQTSVKPIYEMKDQKQLAVEQVIGGITDFIGSSIGEILSRDNVVSNG